ncbi:MAG TPA: ABC transporter substrate-binding protein [Mycobacterium sp.]|uniref:ABC transporter substrate-binding protein n=1 Tax=Mycobacterium sp. TaxID=1785 RepID=UPI002D0558A5|nr:ABC transporter substrate-binding protein [Mycobacterium sp.]HXO82279.1 ABC transporter substrate-binding protein [Mycobacterium sp.]
MPTRIPARRALPLVVALVAALLSGCGHSASTGGSGAGVTLRLGYITRITHASALVAVDRGLFTKNLGSSATLVTQPFQQGIAEVTALLSDKLDAAYIGTNPAFNAWQKSHGTAINIVSGSALGGTSFVVKPDIKTAQDLRGKTVADPGLGGNHDISLRSWLKDNGLQTNTQGGGDVSVKPTKPESAILQEFATNQIAGAAESAPYDVELVKAGGVKLWPDPGTITVLVVRQDFLKAHPEAVSALLRGQVQADDLLHNDPAAAAQSANNRLAKDLGKGLTPDVLNASLQETTFTNDPNTASLNDQVRKAVSVGLLDPLSLDGLVDLRLLNEVLKTSGKSQVNS